MQIKKRALPVFLLVCVSAIQAFQLNNSAGIGVKLFSFLFPGSHLAQYSNPIVAKPGSNDIAA